MDHFEEEALESVPLQATYFFRCVDNTFDIWQHGPETLPQFLDHLNSVLNNIIFTKEMEKGGTLPLLDIVISRKLGHGVYQKPTLLYI